MNQAVPFKDHWKEQRLFLSRLIAAAVVILLLTSVLVGRLFQLQVVEHQQFADLRKELHGDRVRGRRNEPTHRSISGRVERVVSAHWSSTSAPTRTNIEAYRIAAA